MILSDFTVVRYRLHYYLEDSIKLPAYTGSMWRGALGWGLRENVCQRSLDDDCAACSLRLDCLYALCFEDFSLPEAYGLNAINNRPPRPFILEPAPVKQRYLKAEDDLTVDLVLPDKANAWLWHLLAGFQTAGQKGLGARRARAMLYAVDQQKTDLSWQTIYSLQQEFSPLSALPIDIPVCPQAVRIVLLTPLRLKHHGKIVSVQGFKLSLMIRALLSRLAALRCLYGSDVEGDRRYDAFSHYDQGVLQQELSWYAWSHWSNRQKTFVAFDGLVGFVEVGGDALTDIWAALWLGQWLHVGSGATFGLGRYRLEFI